MLSRLDTGAAAMPRMRLGPCACGDVGEEAACAAAAAADTAAAASTSPVCGAMCMLTAPLLPTAEAPVPNPPAPPPATEGEPCKPRNELLDSAVSRSTTRALGATVLGSLIA